MRHLVGQFATAILSAVFVILPARADNLLQHGWVQVFQQTGQGGPPVSYDADGDVLSISSQVRYRTFLPCAGPPSSCVESMLTGYQTLLARIDDSGSFLGGVYSFVGTAPDLGITTPRVLLAGTVTGNRSTIRIDPGPCPNGCGADLLLQIDMATLFADPALGDWGRQMWFGSHAYGLVPPGVTSANLYAHDWTLPGPSDYWVILATNPVPEPATLSLAAFGLLVLVARRAKR